MGRHVSTRAPQNLQAKKAVGLVTVVDLRPSWVEITLDTLGPVVTIVAPPVVEPPEDWVLLLTSSEVIGGASFTLTDSFGNVYPLGFEYLSPIEIEVAVPTTSMSPGPAEVRVEVMDDTFNLTTRLVNFEVHGEVPFDAQVTLVNAFHVNMEVNDPVAADVEMDHAVDVDVEVNSAFEVAIETDPAFEVDVELTGD